MTAPDFPQSQRYHARTEPPPGLARYLTLSYLALIVYASLHPFSGWRDPGISPFIFMDAAWPRYWTVFDLATNVAAYVPFSFFLGQCPRNPRHRPLAGLLACLAGTALSFTMESVQSYLPSRVASNLDFYGNTLGACLGALLSFAFGPRCLTAMVRAQQLLFVPIPHIEYGLVLVGLWLLAQLSPETLLFGSGDLRRLLDISPAVPYAAQSFFALETGTIVCNTLAVGLILRALIASGKHAHRVLPWFFVTALAVRTLATAILVSPQSALSWLTPGASLGLFIGGAALCLALALGEAWRIALAAAALMAGTVLVNLAPPNPYSAAALAAWRQGNFLNFNGLTRFAASFWPFLALPCLILLGRRSAPERPQPPTPQENE